MKNIIKAASVFAAVSAMLFMASCTGRVGEDVYDGDEYAEDLTDGITSDEEVYESPANMLDMSPDFSGNGR